MHKVLPRAKLSHNTSLNLTTKATSEGDKGGQTQSQRPCDANTAVLLLGLKSKPTGGPSPASAASRPGRLSAPVLHCSLERAEFCRKMPHLCSGRGLAPGRRAETTRAGVNLTVIFLRKQTPRATS